MTSRNAAALTPTNLPEDPVFVRPRRWSNLTGMPLSGTYDHIYAGRLRAVKIGRNWFIHASEINDFFERYNENDVA